MGQTPLMDYSSTGYTGGNFGGGKKVSRSSVRRRSSTCGLERKPWDLP